MTKRWRDKDWIMIGQASPDTHKYFRAAEAHGRIAVADRSGYYPHQTDDGVLWVDFKRDIQVWDDREGIHIHLPVVDDKGQTSATPLTVTEYRWVKREIWPRPLPEAPEAI